jgi:hypothetical protein
MKVVQRAKNQHPRQIRSDRDNPIKQLDHELHEKLKGNELNENSSPS